MRKSIGLCSAVLALTLGVGPAAQAFTLTVVPQTPTVSLGGTFTVDVVAAGLLSGSAPSLGVYDLDFTYDSSVLSFAGATFGTGLDVEGLGLNDQLVGSGTPGTVNLFELSFNSIEALNQLQSDAFTLFTLTFDAASAGTSALALTINALGSAEGDSLGALADILDSSVTVAPVPLPAAAWLLLAGLAGMAGFRRRS